MTASGRPTSDRELLDVEAFHQRCQRWHRLFKPYPHRSTAERDHVYFECQGWLFFAGPSAKNCRCDTRPRDAATAATSEST